MNYLTGQQQLFVAMQLHNWVYGHREAFKRLNGKFCKHAYAFFW